MQEKPERHGRHIEWQLVFAGQKLLTLVMAGCQEMVPTWEEQQHEDQESHDVGFWESLCSGEASCGSVE